MKFKIEKKYLYWGLTAFLVIAASMIFYYMLFHMNNIRSGFRVLIKICMPIIDGLVLAYLMTPIVNHLERRIFIPLCERMHVEESPKRKKYIRFLSAFITVCALFALIYWFCSMIIPQLIESIQNIALQFPYYVTNLQTWLENILANNQELETLVNSLLNQYSKEINQYLNTKLVPQLNIVLQQVSTSLFSSIVSVLVTLWNFIIGLIISIYLLFSKESFAGQCKKLIYALFSEENANSFIRNIRFVNRTFGGFISGKLVDSLIIGMLCFIGMTLFGFPYPVLISVIIGVTNIIPFFGPYIGAVPSTLLILMVNPVQAIYFVIFILVLQQFDGNFLGPKILGNKTGLSSFWVIFSITVLGGFFGILGMAVGVPVFAVLYAGVRAFVDNTLKKKGLSTSTVDYLNLSEIRDNEFIELPPPRLNEKKSRKHTNQDNASGTMPQSNDKLESDDMPETDYDMTELNTKKHTDMKDS